MDPQERLKKRNLDRVQVPVLIQKTGYEMDGTESFIPVPSAKKDFDDAAGWEYIRLPSKISQ